jgi:cell fate regulator YaaT (PSP1 superfamily)
MAGPMFDRKLNFKFLTEGLEALGLDDPTQQLEKIDDYFENTESRTKAFKEAGKNLLASQQISEESNEYSYHGCEHEWPVYVIEFKAGRTDYYYMPKGSNEMPLEVGELAIVEADRGKDLGKVIENALYSNEEMLQYQATHVDPLVDSHNAVGKLITPKKIYRRAEPSEVAMLLEKSQDEEKANALCQSKIRQKKLPMEIVDAEYQWDRRKLTFYFVAEKRIDFRELVRELFKIYKTRIWM